jgi:hypothetical protein
MDLHFTSSPAIPKNRLGADEAEAHWRIANALLPRRDEDAARQAQPSPMPSAGRDVEPARTFSSICPPTSASTFFRFSRAMFFARAEEAART